MEPLFELSAFTFMVLRYRSRQNLMHGRSGQDRMSLAELMDLRIELLGIPVRLGRGVLDSLVKWEVERRVKRLEREIERESHTAMYLTGSLGFSVDTLHHVAPSPLPTIASPTAMTEMPAPVPPRPPLPEDE